jgi:hypothetical protein
MGRDSSIAGKRTTNMDKNTRMDRDNPNMDKNTANTDSDISEMDLEIDMGSNVDMGKDVHNGGTNAKVAHNEGAKALVLELGQPPLLEKPPSMKLKVQ